jgi:hypothetical protein
VANLVHEANVIDDCRRHRANRGAVRGAIPWDERGGPLFDVSAKQWLEESCAAWKASTRSQYQQILKSQLSPAFSELRVSAIAETRIRQLLTRLQYGGLSARRII